jgi:hypothetical protein
MNMDITDDAVSSHSTVLPQFWELVSVEMDDAGIERVRIDVIVEDELYDPLASPMIATEQKRAALAPPVESPSFQLANASDPNGRVADNSRLMAA